MGAIIFLDDWDEANALIKHADTAIYYVKERGKNNCNIFVKFIICHLGDR